MKQTVDKIRSQYKTLKADITLQNQKKENPKQSLDAGIQTDFPTLPFSSHRGDLDEDQPSVSESPETEDEEKKKLDDYLIEFLDDSLNVIGQAKPEIPSPRISDSALLIEEEQENQEAIEDIQAVITSGLVREEAALCLEEVEEVKIAE